MSMILRKSGLSNVSENGGKQNSRKTYGHEKELTFTKGPATSEETYGHDEEANGYQYIRSQNA